MFRIVMAVALFVSMSIAVVGCDPSTEVKTGTTKVTKENVLPRIDPKKEKDFVSTDTDVAVSITVRNKTKSAITLHWLDEMAGDRVHYKDIAAGAEVVQETFQDH